MFTSTQKTAAATKIEVFVYFSCFVKYSNAGFNGVPHDQLASVSAQLSSAQLILLHVPTARRRVYRWTLQAGAATAIAMPTAEQPDRSTNSTKLRSRVGRERLLTHFFPARTKKFSWQQVDEATASGSHRILGAYTYW